MEKIAPERGAIDQFFGLIDENLELNPNFPGIPPRQ